jgi:hypothetical protein
MNKLLDATNILCEDPKTFKMLTGIAKESITSIIQETLPRFVLRFPNSASTWPFIVGLLFVFMRHYPSLSFLAWMFALSKSTVHHYIEVGRKYVYGWARPRISLKTAQERLWKAVQVCGRWITLVMDGKEQKCVSSIDFQVEEKCYSGKYKDHTVVFLAVCDPIEGKILYIGHTREGSKNDRSLYTEFDWEQLLKDSGECILADKGFTQSTVVLTKHRRGPEPFTVQESRENAAIDKIRIIIENFFCWAGTFNIFSLPFRTKSVFKNKEPLKNLLESHHQYWCIGAGLLNEFSALRK